jgi:K+-transporting ATPase KdpF subunit
MCVFAKDCEAAMSEAFIGLLVAVALAAYLVHALLKPEKY